MFYLSMFIFIIIFVISQGVLSYLFFYLYKYNKLCIIFFDFFFIDFISFIPI